MTPKFLLFARRLALLTPTIVGCGSSTPPPTTTVVSPPAPTTTTTSEPVAVDGPCRCSWENDATAAPRVCKKGEINHAGDKCVPQAHSKQPDWVEGPLPPPDLANV